MAVVADETSPHRDGRGPLLLSPGPFHEGFLYEGPTFWETSHFHSGKGKMRPSDGFKFSFGLNQTTVGGYWVLKDFGLYDEKRKSVQVVSKKGTRLTFSFHPAKAAAGMKAEFFV